MINLIKNNDNNYKNIVFATTELNEMNIKLKEFLNKIGITKLNLTSVGNSIATGYSMNDSIKPFLLRNEGLKADDIDIIFRAYARAQDNNDEHIFEWFLKNYKQSDINKKVQLDFISDKGMPHENVSEHDVYKYYPTDISNDIGLKDLIKEKGDDLANIIIYNGVTGSFLDNVTRHGLHKNLYGFKRDLVSLESSLKLIYLVNPYTQVYVCGMPNILGIHVTDLINKSIKKTCKMYPNCIYVAPVPQHFLYKKNRKMTVDIHYNDEEYLNLNKMVLSAIVNNYLPVKALTEFDLAMKYYSNNAEYGKESVIKRIMDNIFSKYELTSSQLKKMMKYYKERYPYDYYYTPRDKVLSEIKGKRGR